VEALLPDSVKGVLLGLLAVMFVLNRLARSHPDVRWLQIFRLPQVQLTEEERARRRRSANRMAALELILAGFVLPLLYIASTVMMFNNFKAGSTIIVAACSLLCISLGIWIFARNRDRKEQAPRL
jgi:hypothetical protein